MLRVLFGDEMIALLNDGHLRAETVEGLTKLAADVAASDDDQCRGSSVSSIRLSFVRNGTPSRPAILGIIGRISVAMK
jgi:hypothetical protein